MTRKNALVILCIAAITGGCATRLTVNKPYAEVRTALKSMEQKINHGLPSMTQWLATNGTALSHGAIPPPPPTSTSTSHRGLGLDWGAATAGESPKGASYFLHITEGDPSNNSISPYGDTHTSIKAKPAGADRTNIKIVSKQIGFIYDSRVRKIEDQRRQELLEIVDGPR